MAAWFSLVRHGARGAAAIGSRGVVWPASSGCRLRPRTDRVGELLPPCGGWAPLQPASPCLWLRPRTDHVEFKVERMDITTATMKLCGAVSRVGPSAARVALFVPARLCACSELACRAESVRCAPALHCLCTRKSMEGHGRSTYCDPPAIHYEAKTLDRTRGYKTPIKRV